MSRLEELHKAYEDNQKKTENEWVFVYNDLPKSRKLVHLWVMEPNGVSRFFVPGRYSEEEGVWMDVFYNWVQWNAVAWKDIQGGTHNA